MDTPVWLVFLAALLTALATGLGALPFVFVHSMSRIWLGISTAIAAGIMLAASVALLREATVYSSWRTVGGTLAGIVFIVAFRRVLRNHDHFSAGSLRGVDARKAIMIVAIMTAHSFTEGVGVGVAYGGGKELGAFITAAIAVHNIPEGLAISLVLVPRGVKVRTAAAWSIFSSLPQPLMAVPAFIFVEAFGPFLPAGLGFAAGAMVWMVVVELTPDALAAAPRVTVALAGVLAFGAMMAFQELVL